MDQDLRSKTWTVTRADSSLSHILKAGDRIMFYGEGDTCGCICLDGSLQRRPVWENTYICEAPSRKPLASGAEATALSITGAMLSQEHRPFMLEAVLVDFAGDLQLFGSIHESHEVPRQSLADRVSDALASAGGTPPAGGLTLPGDDEPFGHASGHWHAED